MKQSALDKIVERAAVEAVAKKEVSSVDDFKKGVNAGVAHGVFWLEAEILGYLDKSNALDQADRYRLMMFIDDMTTLRKG